MAGEDLVEVVDLDEQVLDVVSRAEMRRRNLRHRATYIVVRNGHRQVLAHQRAGWKDIWPSRWDLAFGGVCAVGESWVDAARRELAEEAGVSAPLRDRGRVDFESDDTRVVGRIFDARHDGPFTFGDGEVVADEWVDVTNLASWVDRHELCDDTRAVVLPRLLPPLH